MTTTSQKNQCCTYDITFSEKYTTKQQIIDFCNKHCKKWCFQFEEGESGYKHYQARISLKEKKFLGQLEKILPANHGNISITSKENWTNDFYVTKEEGRLDGPWTDRDEIKYIPKQVRDIKNLKPWQKAMQYILDDWDTRFIHVIVDTKGNTGKSTFIAWMCNIMNARQIPLANDHEKILRMVYDMPDSKIYLINMPRAIKKERLFQFWGAIETVKDGYSYDDRYEFKDKWRDCPNICVFTNIEPDKDLLSEDRWVIWKIDEKHDHIYLENKNCEYAKKFQNKIDRLWEYCPECVKQCLH